MTPAALAALHAAAFTTSRPWSAAEFATLLDSPGILLVGDAEGIALGRVTLDEAELLTIAVPPSLRRAGRGRAVLAAFETAVAARGATRLFLEVADDNAAARALYAGAGYEESGRRPGYYTAPDKRRSDALVLTKSLSGD